MWKIKREMELGKRLKKNRELRKITQQEMAEACGLSKNYISAMERGVNKCNAQTLITYAKKLNMSLDELVGIEASNDIIPELKRALSEMSEDKQRKLLQIIYIMEK